MVVVCLLLFLVSLYKLYVNCLLHTSLLIHTRSISCLLLHICFRKITYLYFTFLFVHGMIRFSMLEIESSTQECAVLINISSCDRLISNHMFLSKCIPSEVWIWDRPFVRTSKWLTIRLVRWLYNTHKFVIYWGLTVDELKTQYT